MNPRPAPTLSHASGVACRNGGSALRGVSGVTLLMLVSMVLATSPALGAKPSVVVGEQVRLAESRLPRSGQQSITESFGVRKDTSNHETRPGACLSGASSVRLCRARSFASCVADRGERVLARRLVRNEQMNLPPPALA